MAESVYSKIGKEVGKDVRFVRAVAHHPFEFFSELMEDPQDHRPMRFRYLGVFFVKPYWRKGLRRSTKVGLPPEGSEIWARVPEKKFNKVYRNLKQGKIERSTFVTLDGQEICPVEDVQFWVKQI